MFGLYYTRYGPKVLSGDKANLVLESVLNGNLRFTDILESTGYSKSTVNFILGNLVDEGYIYAAGEGRAKTYRGIVLRALFFDDADADMPSVPEEDVDDLVRNIEGHILGMSIGSLRAAGASIWPVISEMGKFMGPAAYASLSDWSFDHVIGSMRDYLAKAEIADIDISSEGSRFVFTYAISPRHSDAMAEMLSFFVKDFVMTYISSFMGHRYVATSFGSDDGRYILVLDATEYDNPFRSRLDFKLEKVESVPELPAIVGISTHIEVVSNMQMVRILRHLEGRRLTVAQISEDLGIPAPTVFKYMSTMKSLGVIASDGRKYGEVYWRDLPDIFPWSMPESVDYDFRSISMKAWEYPEHFYDVAIDFILTYMGALGFDLGQFLSRTGGAAAATIHSRYPDLSVPEIIGMMDADPENRLVFRIASEDPLVIERESKRPLSLPVANGLRMFYNSFFGTLIELYSGRRPVMKRSRLYGEGNTGHQLTFDVNEVSYE